VPDEISNFFGYFISKLQFLYLTSNIFQEISFKLKHSFTMHKKFSPNLIWLFIEVILWLFTIHYIYSNDKMRSNWSWGIFLSTWRKSLYQFSYFSNKQNINSSTYENPAICIFNWEILKDIWCKEKCSRIISKFSLFV